MPAPVVAEVVRCWHCRKVIAEAWGSGTRITCRHCGAVNQ